VKLWPDWSAGAQPSPERPGVSVLHESDELKVVLVTLNPGQALPPHPGPAASFHFLAGDGVMVVDEEEAAVGPGSTAIAPPGSRRSVRAVSRVVFLGNLGDPGSEDDPH
jgi:quercetin dioxygenase-like cupin family protein